MQKSIIGAFFVLILSASFVTAATKTFEGKIVALSTTNSYVTGKATSWIQVEGGSWSSCPSSDQGHGNLVLIAFDEDEKELLSMALTAFTTGIEVKASAVTRPSPEYCELRYMTFK